MTTETQIAPCPNPECRAACEIDCMRANPAGNPIGNVRCTKNCGYQGPGPYIMEEAIRLHNLIALCRSDALVTISDEAIHKMCGYLEHDPEGSPCMKCPEWEETDHHGRCQRMCYGLAREHIAKSLDTLGITHSVISKHRKGI